MISEVTAKGLEAQLKAEIRANELGYVVSKPTTDCCRYDMIIDTGNELKRVQVKYCDCKSPEADGAVKVNLRKFSLNKNERPFYTESEIDALVVYIKPVEKLCYFPIEVVSGKKSITIRYEASKNNQTARTYNCFDYLW